jgi:hypothetical protein
MEELVMEQGDAIDGAGWRLPGVEVRDFPSARRLLPIQGASREAAAARHRHVLLVIGVIVL